MWKQGDGSVCDPTFSSWGCGGGGRCKPPSGARGGAPEANAFWQQSIENWLKIRSLGRRLTLQSTPDPISDVLPRPTECSWPAVGQQTVLLKMGLPLFLT